MKALKVIFGIFTVLFVLAAVVVAMMFEADTIKTFWEAFKYLGFFGVLAILCFIGAINAADAEENRANPTIHRKGSKVINHIDYNKLKGGKSR